MVGCGEKGRISVLGRIAVVDDKLKLLMDAFVRPSMKVTNFRTKWSGLTWEKLKYGESFESIQKKFLSIVEHYRKESSSGVVFVGHDISNDFQVLKWSPPETDIRDTSTYIPLRKLLLKALVEKGEIGPSQKDNYLRQKPSLKTLSMHILNTKIQQGSHCPLEDARSTMMLYLKVREKWETLMQNKCSILSAPVSVPLKNEHQEDLGEPVNNTPKKNRKKPNKNRRIFTKSNTPSR
ncbi:RNA exonuclease 4 [Cryptosporidium felis]|nr:RNA exonuclease 4 [Cryptosporidium felis]